MPPGLVVVFGIRDGDAVALGGHVDVAISVERDGVGLVRGKRVRARSAPSGVVSPGIFRDAITGKAAACGQPDVAVRGAHADVEDALAQRPRKRVRARETSDDFVGLPLVAVVDADAVVEVPRPDSALVVARQRP